MKIERLGKIISSGETEMLGGSIHFPSVIRVPNWVNNPLGKYYLYFSHHFGEYIRLAYSDSLTGPWSIHRPGALHLTETQFSDRTITGKSRNDHSTALLGQISNTIFRYYRFVARRLNRSVSLPHISSPDVHIDTQNETIRLYYHGLEATSTDQFTRVAVSDDGISFKSKPERLGSPYFRVFNWNDCYYALAQDISSTEETERGVIVYRSSDGLTKFEQGPTILKQGVRHTGLRVRENKLEIYFTRIGDAPERILRSDIELSVDWNNWSPSEPVSVLRPESNYEGANLPTSPSTPGTTAGRVNGLRDPFIFSDNNGGTYLFYAIGGERGIALAKFIE